MHHNLQYCIWLAPLPYFQHLLSAVVGSVALEVLLAASILIQRLYSSCTMSHFVRVVVLEVEFAESEAES